MANVGRPRKNAEQKEENMEKKTFNGTHVALSIAQVDGKWNVVKVSIDPITKEAGEVSLLPQEDKADALYRFRILAAEEIFLED